MLDREALARVIDVHGKGHRLFRWIHGPFDPDALNFSYIHDALSADGAAAEWLRRNRGLLPPEACPEPPQLPALARLLLSFLRAAYETTRSFRPSETGCSCDFCAFLVNREHMRLKETSKRGREKARVLKLSALQALAREEGLPAASAAVAVFLDGHAALSGDAALASYGRTLLDKEGEAGPEDGLCFLWREFAWDGAELKPDLDLCADAVLAAEALLVRHMAEPA